MADTPRTQLERAFRLIQQERLDEASALLQPLVKKEPNNADAWWLLANAVTEPEDARNALENVMRLTPNNSEARDLLDQLNAAVVSPMDDFGDINFDDPFAGLDAKPASGEPTDLNALFDDDVPSFVREGSSPAGQAITAKTIRDFTTDDDEALLAALDAPTTEAATMGKSQKSAKPQAAKAGNMAISSKSSPLAALANNRRLLLPLGLVALVVLLLLIVVVVILPVLNPPPPATVVANVATGVPSVAPVVATVAATSALVPTTSAATIIPTTAALAATNVPATSTSASASTTGISIADISAQTVTALQTAGINNAQVNVVLTSLGQTLTARFCGPYGPKLDGNVRTAMDVVAAQGTKVSDQIQGIGVEVDSCNDQTQVYAKEIAAIKDVLAYINKTLPAAQFRSSWKTS